MKFCKIIAGCVCAAVCFVGATQAAPQVDVTVKATVPHIFAIDDALEGNEGKEVQLINEHTGLPEEKTLEITPKYSGRAKIRIHSENGQGDDCRVLNGGGEHLIYTVSYNGAPIANDGSSNAVDFAKGNAFELTFSLNNGQDLSAGTEYEDTLTVSFANPD